jgi:hypothetical protein
MNDNEPTYQKMVPVNPYEQYNPYTGLPNTPPPPPPPNVKHPIKWRIVVMYVFIVVISAAFSIGGLILAFHIYTSVQGTPTKVPTFVPTATATQPYTASTIVAANSSTPTKTLQAYCDAIKSKDYQTAYNQLSSNVQSQITEAQFASVEDGGIKPLGGVSSCSVSNVSQGDTTATGTITYTFGNGTSGPLPYALVKENNTWKISREGNGG